MPANAKPNSALSRGKTMKRRLTTTLLTAACLAIPMALAPAGAAHAQSVMRPANDLVLSIGRGQLINVPGTMADVFVANDGIADVQIKSTHQLYVFGKAGGETTVYASNSAGTVIWSANVKVGSNIESVDQMLRLAMPEARIGVSTMSSNTFLLTGTIAAPEDAAEAERLVQAYVGKDANVISRLKTATPLQVNLQVRIAEVNRSLARNIGVNLTTIDGSGGFKFGLGQGRSIGSTFTTDPNLPLGMGSSVTGFTIDPITGTIVAKPGTVVSPLANSTTLAGMGRFLGLNILGALDAGETVGLVSTLAQPNLTALSGETADFLAGGEYPIPVSQGLGSTSVEYKKYGVSLAYTPTVLANGRISLRVRPEVSDLSSDGAVQINGFTVPALTVRRAETTVELGSGQSFMIAGLMKNASQNTLKKLPGAGDLPVLGALFRSTAYQRGETELVVVVTPYLVSPVDANDIKLPTDGFRAPNALQQLLGGMDNDGVTDGSRPKPKAAPDRSEPAPGPKVGDASDAGARGSSSNSGKGRSRTAAASVPSPGFNLK
jgi:pilus assembly protein CpaC